jgi:hypothetical protein
MAQKRALSGRAVSRAPTAAGLWGVVGVVEGGGRGEREVRAESSVSVAAGAAGHLALSLSVSPRLRAPPCGAATPPRFAGSGGSPCCCCCHGGHIEAGGGGLGEKGGRSEKASLLCVVRSLSCARAPGCRMRMRGCRMAWSASRRLVCLCVFLVWVKELGAGRSGGRRRVERGERRLRCVLTGRDHSYLLHLGPLRPIPARSQASAQSRRTHRSASHRDCPWKSRVGGGDLAGRCVVHAPDRHTPAPAPARPRSLPPAQPAASLSLIRASQKNKTRRILTTGRGGASPKKRRKKRRSKENHLSTDPPR